MVLRKEVPVKYRCMVVVRWPYGRYATTYVQQDVKLIVISFRGIAVSIQITPCRDVACTEGLEVMHAQAVDVVLRWGISGQLRCQEGSD